MRASSSLLSVSSLLALPLLLTACGDSSPPATPANDDVQAAATERVSISIKGSDSEVNLVQRMAETFMAEHPEVSISVTGGGSGTGIAALVEGTIDLANSSRELKGTEKVAASRNKVEPVATIFATDGLSVIVNEANPIDELSLDQVGALFRGETASWDGLGHSGEVTPYGRQSNSGTYSFFRGAVVNGDFGETVREMNGNAQIVEGVRSDPSAVGYVAVGYVQKNTDGLKVLKISKDGGAATSPLDAEAVLSGTYPIARPLYQYSNGEPSGALKDFLRYELSPEGEAIVSEMGFYPVAEAWRPQNAHVN